jgi:hypothetical protein
MSMMWTGRRMAALAVAAMTTVVLGAAGCATSEPRPGDSAATYRVSGTVRTSPGCPGPTRLDSPCPDRPLAAAEVQATRDATVVATTLTDAAGRYTLNLPSGSYQITVTNVGGYKSRATRSIVLPPGTVVDLTVDSGMR